MNSETPITDARVAAICDRYPLSGTNVEWFLRFHELASFTGSLELRCKRLEEALTRIRDGALVSSAQSNPHFNPKWIAYEALADQQEEKP